MSLLRHLSRPRRYLCQQCLRRQHTLASDQSPVKTWASEVQNEVERRTAWEEQAGRIRSGAQQSMLSVLEERGFVKDVAGGRQTLDWLLTEKRIGVYVGVDPTAPSLHIGHLLPLMALYWMYIHGYNTTTLLGGGTVQIGDPSGRTTARSRVEGNVHDLNAKSIDWQLQRLWKHVRVLGVKHNYSPLISRKRYVANNRKWFENLSAVTLMRDLGSGMRLGSMLARDSVKLRMENGEGMAISEFSYPLFQAYDWWHMYENGGVQMQIGGSDQYGNICAGMDAVSHMRKIRRIENQVVEGEDDPSLAAYGLTTPLLTTASGEKFGKSAGNAVWLDDQMTSPFDLYQYFLRTADDDVERYLKLFTFLPLENIQLLMEKQKQDESKRVAQHKLALEVVELAHGAAEAKKVEMAHKETFGHGKNTFSIVVLRKTLEEAKASQDPSKNVPMDSFQKLLAAHKKTFAAASSAQPPSTESFTKTENLVTIPLSMLQPGSFPRIFHAAGLTSSNSEAHRLIAKKGAYVVVPNSSTVDNPTALKWVAIDAGAASTADPKQFLIDWEALVLRSGKTTFKICHVVKDEKLEALKADGKLETEEVNGHDTEKDIESK